MTRKITNTCLAARIPTAALRMQMRSLLINDIRCGDSLSETSLRHGKWMIMNDR